MSAQTIHILNVGALFVHGIGHTLGLWNQEKSVLFSKLTKDQMKHIVGSIWVLVALGILLQHCKSSELSFQQVGGDQQQSYLQ